MTRDKAMDYQAPGTPLWPIGLLLALLASFLLGLWFGTLHIAHLGPVDARIDRIEWNGRVWVPVQDNKEEAGE